MKNDIIRKESVDVTGNTSIGISHRTRTIPYEMFQIEKDCKNQAYAFIIGSGLLEAFDEFCKITQDVKDFHALCVDLSYDSIKEDNHGRKIKNRG